MDVEALNHFFEQSLVYNDSKCIFVKGYNHVQQVRVAKQHIEVCP